MDTKDISKVKSPRNRGRPSYAPEEKKQPHTLTLSNEAWSNLEVTSRNLGFGSVSLLVENIGSKKIGLKILDGGQVDHDPVQQQDIYVRIKSLIAPPSVVFSSLLSFVRMVAKQFQLDKDENLDDLVCDVLKRAISVVFLIGYICPERYINNPSAYIRTVSYRILLARYRNGPSHHRKPVALRLSSAKRNACIAKIHNMFTTLEAARSRNYSIVRMKVIDNLTWGQIKQILSLQGEEVSIEDLRRRVKIGLAQLREDINKFPGKGLIKKSKTPHPAEKDAYRYLDLLAEFDLGISRAYDMEDFLFDSKDDVAIDFWLNEIDSQLGMIDGGATWNQEQEMIRQRIDDEIDSFFFERIVKFRQVLKVANNREDIRNLLDQIMKEEGIIRTDEDEYLEQPTEIPIIRESQLTLKALVTKAVSGAEKDLSRKIDRTLDPEYFDEALLTDKSMNEVTKRKEVTNQEVKQTFGKLNEDLVNLV